MKPVTVGKFRDYLELLRLEETSEAVVWTKLRTISSFAVRSSRPALFAKNGLSAQGWEFSIRRQDITMHDAIGFQGHRHLITEILDDHGPFLTLKTARVVHAACRDKMEDGGGMFFDAALTEKYIKYAQGEPMASNTTCYVLVTPKSVALEPGSLVDVNGMDYRVQIGHTLDAYKNEYEVMRISDL